MPGTFKAMGELDAQSFVIQNGMLKAFSYWIYGYGGAAE